MAYVNDDPQPPRPVRVGDDDPRPPRPGDAEMKRYEEARAKEREIIRHNEIERQKNSANEPTKSVDTSCEGKGKSIGKLLIYSVILLAGLWTVNLFYSLVSNVVVAQSRLEMALAGALLAVTVFVIGFIVVYAWSLFSRLPRIESIKEADFRGNALKMRERIGCSYLARLPEDYPARLGISENGELVVMLKRLRGGHEYADSKAFVADFKSFQAMQDRVAAGIIKKYSLLIAVKTAACPWRIVDMLAVFYNSTRMICEISLVYNRRVDRTQAFRMMLGWIVNLYVSGELGQAIDGVADGVSASLGDMIGEEGIGPAVQSVLPLASKFLGKAVEGGANAYLAYRLGRRSVAAFRYLK